MSIFPRPDIPVESDTKKQSLGSILWRAGRLASLALLLVFGQLAGEAQANNPKRAIERLEGCSKEERKKGCVNILAKRSVGDGKQAIKAQIRGGRIIWYEYDPKTGKIRRTN